MATYECSLAGLIIGTAEKDAILQRLIGICGNEAMIDLFEHEMIFSPTGTQRRPILSIHEDGSLTACPFE